MRPERRRSQQSHPQDKANYLVIGVLFIVLCILLLKNWPDNLAREAFTLAGPIVGGLINYLTTRANSQGDTSVSAGTVENVTVQPERTTTTAPSTNEIYYQDDGKTKELSPEIRDEILFRRK